MKDWHPNIRSLIALLCVVFIIFISMYAKEYIQEKRKEKELPPPPPIETELYTGKIYHIFFHSLIVYPKLAFDGTPHAQGYQDYMITRSEFNKILPILYRDNFVLIDTHLLYSTSTDGTITKRNLIIPKGKKPLILSLDDLSYYRDQDGHGFANRLVLDSNGKVATEITTPEGQTIVTRDGDVVPILDDFIATHPDFSFNGAKGIIALTGYEGILGYRTNLRNGATYNDDVVKVKEVIKQLKKTGWQFASHSYSHDMSFRNDTATLGLVEYDSNKWDTEVRPLVGDTDIFIGPFGQTFQPGDPRRDYILSRGFKILFGVGMDLYLKYFPSYVMMDRANIDGIRLIQTPEHLEEYFDPKEVLDPERGIKI